MTNNLRKVKKDLRSFAKRCQEFKYTDSALITFLITGLVNVSQNLFSAEENKKIEEQKQVISTSIKDFNSRISEAKRENNKLLKDTNLELIQLMEQGDHVVKSPWSSWQYGINAFSNNWGGTYKGRGDKSEKYSYEGKFERSQSRFERNISPLSSNYGLLNKSSNPRSATTSGRYGYEKGYGISSTEKRQEPVASLNIDASIKPKDVHKNPVAAPNVNVSAPVLAPLSIPTVIPATLTIPTPNPPVVKVDLPQPGAKPFVDFSFQNGVLAWFNVDKSTDYKVYDGTTSKYNDGGGHKFWTGYNPFTNQLQANSGVDGSILNKAYTGMVAGAPNSPVNPRAGALFYFHSPNTSNLSNASDRKFIAQNIDMYLAGNIGTPGRSAGLTDGNHEGALGIHTVWNGKLSNIHANLYGRAAFLSLETWWAGKMEFDDTSGKEIKVNIDRVPGVSDSGNENTIFLIYPGTYSSVATAGRARSGSLEGATVQRGGFTGKVNADIKTDKNIIYSVLGTQGSFEINSRGEYNITGNENVVYSGYGYVPNWNNFVGNGIVQDKHQTGMTPTIKLTEAPVINGDRNIVLLFNDKMDDNLAKGIDVYGGINNSDWKKSVIGIYQGEIDARARIGNNDATRVVENNIGIYSRSGQRGTEGTAKISPENDLGGTGSNINYDDDLIHSLQINNIDITFGKNSKNGVMVASERGTVIDVAMTSNLHTSVINATGKTDSTTVDRTYKRL